MKSAKLRCSSLRLTAASGQEPPCHPPEPLSAGASDTAGTISRIITAGGLPGASRCGPEAARSRPASDPTLAESLSQTLETSPMAPDAARRAEAGTAAEMNWSPDTVAIRWIYGTTLSGRSKLDEWPRRMSSAVANRGLVSHAESVLYPAVGYGARIKATRSTPLRRRPAAVVAL